jgi:hypothetical protein
MIAVQSKKGIVLGAATLSSLKKSTDKYVERKGRRGLFYKYLGVVSTALLLFSLLVTYDLKHVALFVGINMLFVSYFLTYFILLERKGK